MPNRSSVSGSELFIVDNSDEDWKVVRYLHDWCQISASIDIATGYFEIGALLALKDEWQKVDKIRILMGDEVSKRTKDAFLRGLEQIKQRLDASIEKEKEKNDFLSGVSAIVDAIRAGKIECRVYRKDKFHAKAYITHGRLPEREPPKVQPYSVKRTYGKLLDKLDAAFSKQKPLFSLAIYYPLGFFKGEKESAEAKWEDNRQKQVVGLIRTQFLKRFESSAHAFEMSCQALLIKILAWVTKHAGTLSEKRNLERWMGRHGELIGYVHNKQHLLFEDDAEVDEDLISDELLADVEELDRGQYDVEAMLDECYNDLDQLVEFLKDLKAFEPKHDDKLQSLIKLLKSDKVLKTGKVLIFSEFAATARYLEGQLKGAGIEGVAEVDSGSKANREDIIRRFAPYYNGIASGDLGRSEIRVLISTDVLSEGLNLQDATRLINYDLHWNPVRLMQRIGRVDRRMNPQTETRLLADHPEQEDLRGKVSYWNFLPPDELEDLLKLYGRVSHKTLRISKTFGIEGRKLLTPDDEFDALKDFNTSYEGETSPQEELHLEYQRLLKAYPDLEQRLNLLPGRVFSGKDNLTPGAQAVFFCYALPAPPAQARDLATGDALLWTEEAGQTRWLMYDVATGEIGEQAPRIAPHIRSTPETARKRAMVDITLADVRAKVEKHLRNTYLKAAQAPAGVKVALKVWMELC